MFRVLLASALILFGCEQKPSPPEISLNGVESSVKKEVVVDTRHLSTELWAVGQQAVFDMLEEASRLDTAIQALLSQPTVGNLAVARQQWRKSLDAFYRAQPFLFADLGSGPVTKNTTVAHWPFYPGFLDSYGQYRNSGLINAIDTPLNLSVVRQYHQQYEANELLLGFYPMAYLLWSEYEPRPVDDFTAVTSLPATLSHKSVKLTQLPQNRRRQLLRLQSEWLLIDSKALYDTWVSGAADQSLLPHQHLRMITDSLLLSLESILLQQDEGGGLPSQFVQQHEAGMQIVLSSTQQYYFDSGLVAYWLMPEERVLAQQLFALLQGGVESEKLKALIVLLSPDTPQTVAKETMLNESVEIKNTP